MKKKCTECSCYLEYQVHHYSLSNFNLVDGTAKLYVGISRAKTLLIILHRWKPSLFIPIIKATQ